MSTVAQAISSAVQARFNCIESGNKEWEDRWEEYILYLVSNCLPSGSGFDDGTKIDLDISDTNKLVFTGGFHHMNPTGSYVGWTSHTVTVTPTFDSFDVEVDSDTLEDDECDDYEDPNHEYCFHFDADENESYIAETFHYALSEDAPLRVETVKEQK